jgi:hypothetical protein
VYMLAQVLAQTRYKRVDLPLRCALGWNQITHWGFLWLEKLSRGTFLFTPKCLSVFRYPAFRPLT